VSVICGQTDAWTDELTHSNLSLTQSTDEDWWLTVRWSELDHSKPAGQPSSARMPSAQLPSRRCRNAARPPGLLLPYITQRRSYLCWKSYIICWIINCPGNYKPWRLTGKIPLKTLVANGGHDLQMTLIIRKTSFVTFTRILEACTVDVGPGIRELKLCDLPSSCSRHFLVYHPRFFVYSRCTLSIVTPWFISKPSLRYFASILCVLRSSVIAILNMASAALDS